MNNLLPQLAHGLTEEKLVQKANPARTWQPRRADPADDKNIPFGLDAAMTKDVHEGARYAVGGALPLDAPNNRGVVSDMYNSVDPSPLSGPERGAAPDAAHIAMPKSVLSFSGGTSAAAATSSRRTQSAADSKESSEPLTLHITNLLGKECMDIYIQRPTSMQASVLRPKMQCSRTLSDTRAKTPKNTESRASGSPLSILFGAVSRISAIITGRHEVQTFRFLPGPIGMEVEFLYDRLICSRVVPESQASEYEEALTGAEVLSVNGARIINLEEFQEAVVGAFSSGQVNIGVAAYRRGHIGKKDFAHFIGSTKTEFKSLLSNMMKSGIDKDHQSDIAGSVQKKGGSDDDDDDDSGSRSSSGSESSKSSKSTARELAAVEALEAKDGIAANEDEGELDEDYIDRGSESDESDDGKGLRIRKSQIKAKPTYGGLDNDLDQGMIVEGRNLRIREDEVDDFTAEFDNFQAKNEVGPEEQQEEEAEEVVMESPAAPLVAEEKASPDEAKDQPSWDYATALEAEEAVPFSVVVCVPSSFRGSLEWGNPKRCVQFTNYSVKWDVQICWIDEEAAIVPRTRLRAGQKHVEMTSPKHLWIIIATPSPKHSRSHEHHSEADVNHEHHLDSASKGTAMILRPCPAALGNRKYTSAMWIPGQSITATQRLRAKVPPPHKLRAEQKLAEFALLPSLMVSVMDGVP